MPEITFDVSYKTQNGANKASVNVDYRLLEEVLIKELNRRPLPAAIMITAVTDAYMPKEDVDPLWERTQR